MIILDWAPQKMSQGLFYIFNGRKVMKKPFEKIRGYRIEKRVDKKGLTINADHLNYIASEVILCNRALSFKYTM